MGKLLTSLKRAQATTTEAIKMILLLGVLIWLAALVNYLLPYELNRYGIYPRVVEGLWGVLAWPFLHGGWLHLLMNTSSLLVLGFFVALRGRSTFFAVTLFIVLIAGLGVWLFGRSAFHIGASGLVFGYFGFLIALAAYERCLSTLFVTAAVIFFYGGMILGVLPSDEFVSWEGHLFGLLAGMAAAALFSRKKSAVRLP